VGGGGNGAYFEPALVFAHSRTLFNASLRI